MRNFRRLAHFPAGHPVAFADAQADDSTSCCPKRWIASVAIRRSRQSSSVSALRVCHHHAGRRRDQRASRRPQGHNERPIPERPRPQDPSRHSGPCRGRQDRRWQRLRLSCRPSARPRGEPIRGDREIVEEQAIVARRIFREYVAGNGPRIAAERLTPRSSRPNGKAWNDTTILAT